MTAVKALQDTLNDNIPLTNAIGAVVDTYDGQRLQVNYPLAPNINHKKTGFGGSLYCAAVVCAWGLLYLKLNESTEDGQIVIFDGNIHYIKPVKADFNAICQLTNDHVWARFIKTFRRMGKARLVIDSDIYCGNDLCARFKGEFVVEKLVPEDAGVLSG